MHAAIGLQFRNVLPRDGGEPGLLPAIDRDHEVPGKAFDETLRTDIVKTLVGERRGKRMQPGTLRAQGEDANCRPEDEPVRRGVLVSIIGPGEPPAANEAAVDIDRVRPFDDDRLFRRRPRRERVAQRNHPGIEYAARGSERLVRLQHNSKLGEVKTADGYERSSAERGGMGARMGESVANPRSTTTRNGGGRSRMRATRLLIRRRPSRCILVTALRPIAGQDPYVQSLDKI